MVERTLKKREGLENYIDILFQAYPTLAVHRALDLPKMTNAWACRTTVGFPEKRERGKENLMKNSNSLVLSACPPGTTER